MDRKRLISAGGGYPFAVVSVAVVTVACLPFRAVLAAPTVMLLYVPVIVGVARVCGVRQSATAAVLSFLALDLLFIPPYYRLTVASLPEWIGLMVFLIVALVAGQQTGQLRQRECAALRRQRELELLNLLSFRIAAEKSAESTAAFIVGQVAEVLGARRAALYVGADAAGSAARCLASAGETAPSSGEEALVAWVLRRGKGISGPLEAGAVWRDELEWVRPDAAIPGVVAEGLYVPLQTSDSLEGVLFAMPGEAESGAWGDEAGPLAAVANLAASALERTRLEVEAAHATALREADRLKTTLVSSVSHELKTPLAAATARVTGLIEEGDAVRPERLREELSAVEADLGRLNGSIGDLLDLSRLESDTWQPHFEQHELGDVLGTVLSRLHADERERVRFELDADLPLVSVDFAQLARAITNLIENALAYSAAESVLVAASATSDGLALRIEDRGPGVPDAEKPRIFEKFFRGAASSSAPAGTGLGLAITREIVLSHEGTVRVEDAAPHGARFVLELPAEPHERRP